MRGLRLPPLREKKLMTTTAGHGLRRTCTMTAAAISLFAFVAAGRAAAADPAPVIPPGISSAIDTGPGNQTDPHVANDLVVYTDDASGAERIHYRTLRNGDDGIVPMSDAGQDALA